MLKKKARVLQNLLYIIVLALLKYLFEGLK